MTLLIQILSHKFLLVFFASGLFTLGIILSNIKKKGIYAFGGTIFFVAGMLNVFFGSKITNSMINDMGAMGTAVVTNVEATSNTYNDRQVMRHHVLLKTETGETVETYFESWDFNIYPEPENGFSYPMVGVEFAVKYLPDDPHQFIILLNQPSAYTDQLECSDLMEEVEAARQKMNFDPENQAFKETYDKLSKISSDKNCFQNFLEGAVNTFELNIDPIQINRSFQINIENQ